MAQPSAAAGTAQASTGPAATALQAAPKGGLDHSVRRLHDRLGITPEQEELWPPVANAMADRAGAVGDAMQAHFNKLRPMSAVEDIQIYQAVADAHVRGLKQLADAVAPLYAATPAPQQKAANKIFGTSMMRRAK